MSAYRSLITAVGTTGQAEEGRLMDLRVVAEVPAALGIVVGEDRAAEEKRERKVLKM